MDNIYKEELMEIYKNPMHKGHMDDPSVKVEGKNPMCGDSITLQLKIEDGVITDAKFDGSACAVSIISAAMATDFIIGKTIEDALKLDKEDLLKMIDLNLTTSRVKCATLIVSAIKDALEIYATD